MTVLAEDAAPGLGSGGTAREPGTMCVPVLGCEPAESPAAGAVLEAGLKLGVAEAG